MPNNDQLEDLRAKIIASMNSSSTTGSDNPSSNKSVSQGSADNNDYKRARRDGGANRYQHESKRPQRVDLRKDSTHQGYNNNNTSQGRRAYKDNRRTQRTYQQYNENEHNRNTSMGKSRFQNDNKPKPTSVQRLRPSFWDKPYPGFEDIPAERVKLAGLFPRPGESHTLNKELLESFKNSDGKELIHNNRRTKILFEEVNFQFCQNSKINNSVIISNIDKTIDIINFKKFITNIVKNWCSNPKFSDYQTANNDISNHMIVTFSSPIASTVIIALKDLIISEFSNIIISRPQGYIEQLDNLNDFCLPKTIAIHNIILSSPSNDLKKDIEKFLIENNISFTTFTPLMGNDDFFSGTILLVLKSMDTLKDYDLLDKIKYSEPNKSELKQKLSDFTFQNLPNLLTMDQKEKENNNNVSKILCLLNCVDPLDLKSDELVDEIRSTLFESFQDDGLQSIKIITPQDENYRLNYDHISENVGNIYLKFGTTEEASKIGNMISGKKFNDRTILCCFVNESDFEIGMF